MNDNFDVTTTSLLNRRGAWPMVSAMSRLLVTAARTHCNAMAAALRRHGQVAGRVPHGHQP